MITEILGNIMIFVLWQNMIKFYHQLIEFRGIVPQTEQNKNSL